MMTHARDTSLLKARREQQGLLLTELADRVSRSPAFLSMCEGGFVPKPQSQLKIAEALDTTPELIWPDEWERAR